MNAVEIEEAVSRLAEAPFDPEAFPFALLEAFGNKQTTLRSSKAVVRTNPISVGCSSGTIFT